MGSSFFLALLLLGCGCAILSAGGEAAKVAQRAALRQRRKRRWRRQTEKKAMRPDKIGMKTEKRGGTLSERIRMTKTENYKKTLTTLLLSFDSTRCKSSNEFDSYSLARSLTIVRSPATLFSSSLQRSCFRSTLNTPRSPLRSSI